MKTLILAREDIDKVLTIDVALEAVESAFREHGFGRVAMPPKLYLHLPQYSGDFRAMPAYVLDAAGVKWVSVYPNNPPKGMPTVLASIIYSDPSSGRPLAIMDGTLITDYRTGASGAIAAKYLARRDSKSFGLIGTGAQARTQLLATTRVFRFGEVLAWSRSDESLNAFLDFATDFPIRQASVEECAGCDIVCTTTPSTKPIVEASWVKEGAHINAIGADAPGKQELDIEILHKAQVVVDDVAQSLHAGEINVAVNKGLFRAEDIYGTLGQVIAGLKAGRVGTELTVFDSTGLAIQDIAVAKVVFQRAKEMGVGQEVGFG